MRRTCSTACYSSSWSASTTERRDERAFLAAFDAIRARLFGALLDSIVGTLRQRERVREHCALLPRMADFALLACSYAEHVAIGAETMMAIIVDNASRQIQEVIESDPLATAVRDLAEKHGRWQGTAGALLAELNARFGYSKERPEGWPKSAKSVGRRLKVLHTTLAEVGVRITWKHSDDRKSRLIELAVREVAQTFETSVMFEASQDAVSRADISSEAFAANVREMSG